MRPFLRSFLALALLAGLSGAALAQETPAPVPQAGQATSARAQCKAQIDSRSLTGPERKAAMRDCMKPQRDACRSQAVAKALPKGPDRKAFMHQCLHGAVAETH
ncbi:PsiF family protein [Methylobacterium komagatae]|uniref:PsiF family protein n=1 Tax=Methylobacterium komagatae TaxID=374425 RepID=A0ABW2BFL4_9HYPH